jgi:hypothetical protein
MTIYHMECAFLLQARCKEFQELLKVAYCALQFIPPWLLHYAFIGVVSGLGASLGYGWRVLVGLLYWFLGFGGL